VLIEIKNELKKILPKFDVLAFTMDVKIEDSSIIEEKIKEYESYIEEEYSLEEILNIPLIKEARDSYKMLGKDPSRYRLACESLLRRLVKGNNLYRINNVVDCGNLLSIELNRSTAILDLNKISGNVFIRIGKESDEYYGIGRGLLNVTNIPLYCDNISPFGSPTSDTERTMVTDSTKSILLMIICFGDYNKDELSKKAIDMFTQYAFATNIEEVKIIEGDE